MNRRLLLGSLFAGACLGALLPFRPVAAEWRRDNKEECARVDDQLKQIENERRAGYTPKQGRRLVARRSKLEQKRREKCR
jgi:hypothetical protein